ncbi:MAG: UvrD-helicase domain-containing protein [Synergistaceae bacterium]|nr:UvrD-helicase domain-containing protein [Synergistaceae bacterium]
MFDFGNANSAQREAIAASDGPVLITAGPGTGKTYTLVQRTLYLIEERGVKPENILIATFTEKAAKELITRISNELYIRGITANINEMYGGQWNLAGEICSYVNNLSEELIADDDIRIARCLMRYVEKLLMSCLLSDSNVFKVEV